MRYSEALFGIALISATVAPSTARATDLSAVLESYLLIEMSDNTFFRAGEDGIEAVGGLTDALSSGITSLPLGSSSAGLVYVFDPTLGTVTRSSMTVGSLFAERAATIGAKKWNLGFRYATFKPSSIDGLDLEDGSVAYHLEWIEGNPGAEGDLVQIRYKLDLDVANLVSFGSYGVGDKTELGVAVPLARVSMKTAVDEQVFALASGGGALEFADGTVERTVERSDSASGIGDIVLRGKYRFWTGRQNSTAAALDVRVPTGDERNFLGSGVTQVKGAIIGSGEYGRVSPHVNLGYTASFGSSGGAEGDVPDEVHGVMGCDFALHRRVTVSMDLLGRYFLDATRVKIVPTRFPLNEEEELPQLAPFQDNAAVNRLALGARFNPKGGSLISVGALMSLGDEGLKNDLALAVGYDQTF